MTCNQMLTITVQRERERDPFRISWAICQARPCEESWVTWHIEVGLRAVQPRLALSRSKLGRPESDFVELLTHWALGSVRLSKKPNKPASLSGFQRLNPKRRPSSCGPYSSLLRLLLPSRFLLSSGIAGSCALPSLLVDLWSRKKPSNRALKLLSGSCYLPHPDKEETGGEDAHFLWDEQAIGVADGVGGWANHGVDAGQYSRALMSHSVDAIEEESKGSIDPLRVLEKAYTRTKAEGSSTACIIALTDQGIRAVNLGDSGFIVVRDGCTIFRSPVQQHDFNFTYQLESNNASDLPSAAQVFSFPVESGDVIVAGTDGLFDNLYNSEITAVVVHGIRAGLGPQVMAQKIAALARQRAQDKNRQTPFSAAAQEAGYRYYGGKLDDITVIVSYITAFGNQAPSCLCT
ncbi:probable protein phosphatase 2C 55 isoform X2 [Musa acuminata AAA Group]|uniref:probable protein phosphatase 2C 55 isoform X2 n=1 Tax=Musa acuminata AAA Group TaxID=214697 RepID=UPI0031D8E0AC